MLLQEHGHPAPARSRSWCALQRSIRWRTTHDNLVTVPSRTRTNRRIAGRQGHTGQASSWKGHTPCKRYARNGRRPLDKSRYRGGDLKVAKFSLPPAPWVNRKRSVQQPPRHLQVPSSAPSPRRGGGTGWRPSCATPGAFHTLAFELVSDEPAT